MTNHEAVPVPVNPEVMPFTFTTSNNQEAPLRAYIEDDGSVWFVAKDVCDVLGLTDVSMSCARLEPEEKGTKKICTLGGMQSMTVISESGMYALIFRSSKPEAKRFRKWVTSEVLPKIRETNRRCIDSAADIFDFISEPDQRTRDKKTFRMMNLDRCPLGTVKKEHKMYRVKTSIATIEAPATATGRKFILEMLDELNIR